MNPQFVTPEIAILLKQKGHTEECMAQYQIAMTTQKDKENGYSGSFGWKKGEVTFDKSYFVNNSKHDYSNKSWLGCGAPLWQEALNWLRTKKVVIAIEYVDCNSQPNHIIKWHNGTCFCEMPMGSDIEKAILKALEFVS